MKDQATILDNRIDYLYQKVEELTDEISIRQMDFLLIKSIQTKQNYWNFRPRHAIKSSKMKTIKISDLHYEMAKEKMKSTKAKRIEEYIEMLVQQEYVKK